MNSEVDKELNQVKADIASLREDMSALLQAVKDSGASQGEKVYQTASEQAQRAGEAARHHTRETYNAFGREVEQRPLTAVATALAAGFVAGLLLDRRH